MNMFLEEHVLIKIKPKYLQYVLSLKVWAPTAERSSSELELLYILEKWKISDLSYSITKPNKTIKSVTTL